MKNVWRALVYNNGNYECRYCHRNPWQTSKELGYAIRLELDHRRARARLGPDCDDFSVNNIGIACHSCNLMKGQMTRYAFHKELWSLAQAFTKNPPKFWLTKH